MINKHLPELLAPAGSIDALKAAVNSGADAVYLAGTDYSARNYAENLTKHQIEEAIEYAHLRGSKVYITVNTLIKDSELEDVAEYLLWLYNIGSDAVIIQDLGVATLCKEIVPKLDRYASTQMTINNIEEVKWAKSQGFKRVILSREMKLEDIREIKSELQDKIELEIFVQGALCYCYSGQCLLSSFIGGRSGNRGRCAQPCRKFYRLFKGKKDEYGKAVNLKKVPNNDNFLLSTRDLSLYTNLEKIYNSKIDSTKIEGRMRSPEYVSTVVNVYREALNALGKGEWSPDEEAVYKLKLAFNRSFTRGYLLEKNKDKIMGREDPSNRGLYLGKIEGYNKNLAIIRSEIPFTLEKGDGLVFINPRNEKEYGMIIEQPQYANKYGKIFLKIKKPVPLNSNVYITRDNSLLKQAHNTIKDNVTLFIPLDVQINWDDENRPLLKGEFKTRENKYEISFTSDFKMELANKKPLSEEQIVSQIKKTGGTPFYIRKINVNYPGNLFMPISKLNSIRRDFLKKAEETLLNTFKPSEKDIKNANTQLNLFKQKSSNETMSTIKSVEETSIGVYASNLEAIKGALNGGCHQIYFEPFLWEQYPRTSPCHPVNAQNYMKTMIKLILEAKKICNAREADLIWKWPPIISQSHLKTMLSILDYLYKKGVSEIMVGSLGLGWAIKKLNPDITLHGSVGVNIWNHLSVHELSPVFDSITISNELTKTEIMQITSNINNSEMSSEFIVQGNLESIISEDCLIPNPPKYHEFLGIKDGKDRIFPVIIDDECRTRVLNSVELCLIDHLPQLNSLGLEYLIIDSRGKTKEYAENITKIYREGLNYTDENPGNLKHLVGLKNRVKKLSQGGITTGNFIRGLKEDS